MSDRVLVSAHRCNRLAEVDAAIALGVDLVEFDVRRRADGSLYVGHDDPRPGDPSLPDVLARLAPSSTMAHLDLKLDRVDGSTDAHLGAVRLATEALGVERVVATTGDDAVIRALRDLDAGLVLGLSLGGSLRGHAWRHRIAIRASELFPGRRVRACGADVVAAQYAIAALGAARYARRADLRLLVWTVDPPYLLRWWLRRGRAWAVTTNRPALALRLRD